MHSVNAIGALLMVLALGLTSAGAQAPAPPPSTPPAEAPSTLRPFAYGAFAAGGAAFVVGAVLGVRARDREDAHHSTTDPRRLAETRDEGEAARDRANIAFLIAGVLGAAGVTLWVLEPKPASVTLSPGGVTWSARW